MTTTLKSLTRSRRILQQKADDVPKNGDEWHRDRLAQFSRRGNRSLTLTPDSANTDLANFLSANASAINAHRLPPPVSLSFVFLGQHTISSPSRSCRNLRTYRCPYASPSARPLREADVRLSFLAMQPHHSPPPGEPPDPDDHHAKKLRLMDVSPPSPERRRRPSASLPSIHHLHPDLPPPNSTYQQHQRVEPRPPPRQFEPPQPSRIQPQPQQLSPPAGFMSSGPAPLTTPLAIVEEARRFAAERPSAAGPQAGQSAASSSSIPEKSLSTAGDSDQDEMVLDQTGPPKKKRRRQALSCTGEFFLSNFALFPPCHLHSRRARLYVHISFRTTSSFHCSFHVHSSYF